MFNNIKNEITFCGKKLSLENGKFARQADGSVMITYGKTKILCTVVYDKKLNAVNDFFPLTVVYQERYHAIGKFPGGFIKRESKPSNNEILISRIIDRTIRPMFDENFMNETQVVCTVFSHEPDVHTDFVALLGAVAAVRISGAPFLETVAGIKVAMIDGQCTSNPSPIGNRETKLDLFISGTSDSVMMVESEAKEISEDEIIVAIEHGLKDIAILTNFVDSFAGTVNGTTGKEPFVANKRSYTEEIFAKVKEISEAQLISAFKVSDKKERSYLISQAKQALMASLITESSTNDDKMSVDKAFKDIEKNIVRQQIVTEDLRIDGRNSKQVRQIEIETNLLPTTHGSALFTRGETQALVTLTLGGDSDEQTVDTIHGVEKERFSLHYNFPAFSVGEMSRFGPPSRRDIGHGNLAKKAVAFIIPDKSEFPFAIRVVSDILESNGSSSMATVCGASLALMAGGVPVKKPVSGIAMGLIKEGDQYVILSDIMGDEDHLGDMDFKVAGTADGITALQMDIKIRGITVEILRNAIAQAKEGRLHILNKMNEALPSAASKMAVAAPKLRTISIKDTQIRQLIGVGGSVIKELCAKSGAAIDIGKDGKVKIMSQSQDIIEKATNMISDILFNIDIGRVYRGKVAKIIEYGAIVELDESGISGMVHISELSVNRVDSIEDIVLLGEPVLVKVLSVENKKPVLSIKSVDQFTGKDISGAVVVKREYSDSGAQPRRSSHNSDSPRRPYNNRRNLESAA